MDLCFGSVLHPDESFRIQGDEVGVGGVGGREVSEDEQNKGGTKRQRSEDLTVLGLLTGIIMDSSL